VTVTILICILACFLYYAMLSYFSMKLALNGSQCIFLEILKVLIQAFLNWKFKLILSKWWCSE